MLCRVEPSLTCGLRTRAGRGKLHQRQSFDDVSVFDVFFDYFGDVFGLDLAVEDAVGVDHNGNAYRAEADRAALR